MKKYLNKSFLISLIVSSIIVLVPGIGGQVVYAFNAGTQEVVINEVAWAGSIGASTDEWIELYNNTSNPIVLDGWTIKEASGAIYNIDFGEIGPNSFFILKDSEEAVSTNSPSIVVNLSLANAGEDLFLYNKSGDLIDIIKNSSKWAAGSSKDYKTMERIDTNLDSIDSNFASAVSANGAFNSQKQLIYGTPGAINSVSINDDQKAILSFSRDEQDNGEAGTYTINLNATNLIDMHSYGFEISYDSNVLEFITGNSTGYIDSKNNSFNLGLENGEKGKLIIGDSFLDQPSKSGAGTLCVLKFKLIDDKFKSTTIDFLSNSYISSRDNDIYSIFQNIEIKNISKSDLEPPENISIQYNGELSIDWDISGDDDIYQVFKLNPLGEYELVQEGKELQYLESGNKVYGQEYSYKIIKKVNQKNSDSVYISLIIDGGIKGDIDNSNRVDSRDLQILSKSFASSYLSKEYNESADLNYDGIIDGTDLVILSFNWGKVFID